MQLQLEIQIAIHLEPLVARYHYMAKKKRKYTKEGKAKSKPKKSSEPVVMQMGGAADDVDDVDFWESQEEGVERAKESLIEEIDNHVCATEIITKDIPKKDKPCSACVQIDLSLKINYFKAVSSILGLILTFVSYKRGKISVMSTGFFLGAFTAFLTRAIMDIYSLRKLKDQSKSQ